MNKREFVMIITKLTVVFGKEVNDEFINIWYSFLKEYSGKEFDVAVNKIVRESKYFPTINEIIERINEMRNPYSNLDAETAWNEFKEIYSANGGCYQKQKIMNKLNPVIKRTIERVGFDRYATSMVDEVPFIRKEFIEIYEQEQKNNYLQLGSQIQNLICKK